MYGPSYSDEPGSHLTFGDLRAAGKDAPKYSVMLNVRLLPGGSIENAAEPRE